jgi:hypothetical protein
MVRPTAPRTVQCYHCQKWFQVGQRAISLSCPGCYRRVLLDDLVISETFRAQQIRTCGRIIVEPKGWISASEIHASAGIRVLGQLSADTVSLSPVIIAAGATWRGNLRAPAIHVEAGASITGGRFEIIARTPLPDGPLPQGLGDETGPRPMTPQERALSQFGR